ncbi:MAG: 4Fe-4S cluster-binding domain-containing protein [Bacteroidetes bacterium]|nr:4Fe-4S cluster-binding domain-containing protein [Bacteroidota bacterium]
MSSKLRINYVLSESVANGPGRRYTIWVQGCSIHCPGCLNVDTWDFDKGYEKDVDELVEEIKKTKGIDGVTITGGEPLDQIGAVYKLCAKLHKFTSVFLTTGYHLYQIQKDYFKIIKVLDIICFGPFDKDQLCKGEWKGSKNQEVIFLTIIGREQLKMPVIQKEIVIDSSGTVLITGFSPQSKKIEAMKIFCPKCQKKGIASALIPGICTACANEQRGICINPLNKEVEVISREVEAIKCDCGGYAERVPCTPEEIKEHDCGKGHECCSRAFVCCICKKRIIKRVEAPDMDLF